MIFVAARILRVDRTAFPAVVAFTITDANGQEHSFAEKEPVIFAQGPSANEPYPAFAEIQCQVLDNWKDAGGRELCRIDIGIPWGVESTEGETKLVVLASQLVKPASAQQSGLDGQPGSSSR